MTEANYRVHIYMTGVDKSRAKALRFAMAEHMRGAGKSALRDMMKRAHEGERVLVHMTNSDDDADAFVRALTREGATLETEGLGVDDDAF